MTKNKKDWYLLGILHKESHVLETSSLILSVNRTVFFGKCLNTVQYIQPDV